MERKGSGNFIYGMPLEQSGRLRVMSVGKRIKKLRLELGMDQGELARAAKIAQSTLSDLERGDSARPRGDSLVRLASALKVDHEWLMTGQGMPQPRVQPDMDEAHLLGMYRAMTEAHRTALIATARALLDSQPDERKSPTQHPRPRRNQ